MIYELINDPSSAIPMASPAVPATAVSSVMLRERCSCQQEKGD